MNYPMRFVLLGLLLCGLSVLFKRNDLWSRLAAFERSTLSVGLLYLFISLWILSIFGDYGDMTSWYQAAIWNCSTGLSFSERRPVSPYGSA